MSDLRSNSPSRYRSIPYRTPYLMAVVWTLIHWCCMTATLTLVIFFLYHHHAGKGAKYKRPIIIAAGGTILTLIVSHYKRRVVRCPLCIGTPLINTGALTHKRSRKFGPLNEGQCSILSIAMTQKFRCMYCGTRYDLLKIPRRQKLDSEESDV